MENYEVKISGSYDEIDIKCPKCKSHKVLASLDLKGYFFVTKCEECGYKKL